jgi:hypothetical protein
MAITFSQLKEYLDQIAAGANLDPSNSGHGVFWDTDYNTFMTGSVPTKNCNGAPVPIVNQADKANSAFYLILKAGWCNMPQMPRTGPFANAPGYTIQLSDGTTLAGDKVLADIQAWLIAGAPENG